MPAINKARGPDRDYLPISAKCPPQWQLDEVDTDSMVAELCRRGYYGGTAKAPTRPCCGQPVKAAAPHKASCKAEADQKARQAAAITAAEDRRRQAEADAAEAKRQEKTAQQRIADQLLTPAEKKEAKAPVVPVAPARKKLSL